MANQAMSEVPKPLKKLVAENPVHKSVPASTEGLNAKHKAWTTTSGHKKARCNGLIVDIPGKRLGLEHKAAANIMSGAPLGHYRNTLLARDII